MTQAPPRRASVPPTGRAMPAAPPDQAAPVPATPVPATPWGQPPPQTPPIRLQVQVTREDELAGQGMLLRARVAEAEGLGGGLFAGGAMLTAIVWLQAGETPLWKGAYPHGGTFVILALLLAGAGLAGWWAEARLLPAIGRRLVMAQLRRLLPAGTPAEAASVTLSAAGLQWQGQGLSRRFGIGLLRGLMEDRDHLVLRFGFGISLVLPRRDLTPEQAEAVVAWAAQHGRGPLW